MPGPSNAEVSTDWRAHVISPYAWDPDPNQVGLVQGEAGGCFAVSSDFPRRAYMKPLNAKTDEGGHSRAAREKIAADLAHDLRLRVPPALLTTRRVAPEGCTPNLVVSLILCPVQFSWGTAKGVPSEANPLGAAMAAALTQCSGLLVFDTWLAQTDHGDHPENLIMGYNPDRLYESGMIFLDYANSLGFNGQWAGGAWQPVQLAAWPPRLLTHLDPPAVAATLDQIERMAEETIREVVQRIPDAHLPEAEKPIIIDGLLGRRGLLRPALRTIPGLGGI